MLKFCRLSFGLQGDETFVGNLSPEVSLTYFWHSGILAFWQCGIVSKHSAERQAE